MNEPPQDSWRYRRQVVRVSLTVIGLMVAYLLRFGGDGTLHVTAMEGLLWLAGAVMLFYIAGPVAEDIVRARAGMAPRRSDPPPSGGTGAA